MRYIGAAWPDAYPVLKTLLKAFSEFPDQLNVEFIGTSYSKAKDDKTELSTFIQDLNLEDQVAEQASRVPYSTALSLQMEADLLLLFGGMQAYYAASKLFGMIASTQPFLAFLHRDSFPAKVLEELGYPYLVTYSHQADDLPENHLSQLIQTLGRLMIEFTNFEGFDLDQPLIKENTALRMTEKFVTPIKAKGE